MTDSHRRPPAPPESGSPDTAPVKSSPLKDAQSLLTGAFFTRTLAAAFVFSAAINLLQLSLPLYSLQVFSRAIPSNNVDTLIMLSVVVVLALSMTALLEVVRTRMFTRAANAMEVKWRPRLSAEVLDSTARGRPDAQTLNDLMEVRGAITRPATAAVLDLPWTPLYIIGIYMIHPVLAGVMMVGMVLIVAFGWLGHVVVHRLMEECKQPGTRAQRLFDAVQSRAGTVRAMRMAPAALDSVVRDSMTAAAMTGQSAERSAAVGAATKWVRMVLQIAVTGVGAWLVMEQHLSFGGMIATSMLVGRAMAAVEQTAGSWGALVKSAQAARRLIPLLKRMEQEPVRDAVPVVPGRLALENVLFVSPRDQKPILRSVSMTIEAGRLACVLGPNRAGKSVLARLLAGVQAPSAGTVRLNGLAVTALTPDDPKAGIGYLPQSPDLLPGTIADNIARFQDATPEEIRAAAERAGVHEIIETLPMGYETATDDPLTPLGGSFAKLIALARAGFGNPALVVMDDPVSGLDENGVAAVRKFAAAMKEQGATVVALCHQPAFLDMADKTFVLQNGMAMEAQPRPHDGQQTATAAGAAAWGRGRAAAAVPAAAVPASA